MSKYGYYLGMTPEQQDIVKMIREFAERELDPVVKEYDEKGEFPVQLHEKWGEMGLFGLDVPEQYGGLGLNAVTRYCISEELAKLENAVERAAILCLGEYISERELPMAVSSAPKNNDAPTLAELQGAAGEEPISMTLDEMERAAILRTLQDTGDNKSEAARRLGITRATLHNKLRRYDME